MVSEKYSTVCRQMICTAEFLQNCSLVAWRKGVEKHFDCFLLLNRCGEFYWFRTELLFQQEMYIYLKVDIESFCRKKSIWKGLKILMTV